jgi:hypothetical protein
MSADRTRLRRSVALAMTMVAAIALGACSDDGDDGSRAAALPTTAPGDSALLCGVVPRSSVATALGRKSGDVDTTGDLTTDSTTGHVNGRCRIRSATGSEPALEAVVQWPSTDEQEAVRSRVDAGDDYIFPTDYAEGYATGSGSSATAEVIWGDYVVSVVDNEPASGRNALKDSVALVHQVVDALDLSKDAAPAS